MENQTRRVIRQATLNQPPIKVAPEGGYHRDWKVTKKSHYSDLQNMAEKNQARKAQADQNVNVIVEAWEKQMSIPQVNGSKWALAKQLSEFAKSVDRPLSAHSFVKRYHLWRHLHDS